MKKVAILIDAGFIQKAYHDLTKRNLDAPKIVLMANSLINSSCEELFRIYYYDAPPFADILVNPLDGSKIDYSSSGLFKAVTSFHIKLAEKDFVAVRLGKLRFGGWKLKDKAIEQIKNGTLIKISPLDLIPDFKQKAVDMRVGLDIAWMAIKRIVDKVILVTADNDFIPVMKFARKEGLHVALAKIDNSITSEMRQHCDQVLSLDLSKI